MSNGNGHRNLAGAPILGQPRPRVGVSFTAFVRRLDPDGTVLTDKVELMPNGQQVATVNRERYMDAEELLGAIRQIVHEELAAVLKAERE